MILKSFGCSFIFGSDLDDAICLPGTTIPSEKTWPAHLAQYLNYSYKSYAWPGSGNLQILETVLNQASISDHADLFVIGWTWIDRFSYDPTHHAENSWWKTIRPTDTTNSAKIYYRDFHSEYADKFSSLGYIRLAIDTLNQKNIPFLMTYMDQLLFDQRWHSSPAVIDLQSYVQPYMTKFENNTFLEWSRKYGYPESESWHPLDDAHRAAGDYMITIFDKQNTVDR
jgi:hypothetical protein